jgi:uncharacterized membrane protein YeaQ/YmgE (transglycosylase-associated protein family)
LLYVTFEVRDAAKARPIRSGGMAWRADAMSVISWIVLGAVLGTAAALVLGSRGRDLWSLIAVGTLGAVLGGLLASILLGLDVVEINLTSLLVAALVAVAMIAILHTLPQAYD